MLIRGMWPPTRRGGVCVIEKLTHHDDQVSSKKSIVYNLLRLRGRHKTGAFVQYVEKIKAPSGEP